MDAAEYCLRYMAVTVNLLIHYGRTKDGQIQGQRAHLAMWLGGPDLDTRQSHTGYIKLMKWRAYPLQVCEAEERISQHS